MAIELDPRKLDWTPITCACKIKLDRYDSEGRGKPTTRYDKNFQRVDVQIDNLPAGTRLRGTFASTCARHHNLKGERTQTQIWTPPCRCKIVQLILGDEKEGGLFGSSKVINQCARHAHVPPAGLQDAIIEEHRQLVEFLERPNPLAITAHIPMAEEGAASG